MQLESLSKHMGPVAGNKSPFSFNKEKEQDRNKLKEMLKRGCTPENLAVIKSIRLIREMKRFYLNILIGDSSIEAQLDSGADVSVISENLLQTILPNWGELRSAENINVSGVTGQKMQISGRKYIPMSFSSKKEESFLHPFVIVKEPNLLLLSSEIMYARKLGIDWSEGGKTPFLTWSGSKNKKRVSPLFPSPSAKIAQLSQEITIDGLSEAVATFELTSPINCSTVSTSNVYDHSVNQKPAQNFLVSPSLSSVTNCQIKSVVRNYSDKRTTLHKNDLLCLVRPVIDPFIHKVTDLSLTENQDELFSEILHSPVFSQAVYNLPKLICSELEAQQKHIESVLTDQEEENLSSYPVRKISLAERPKNDKNLQDRKADLTFFDFPENSKEPTEQEKNEMLDKIYVDQDDQANFEIIPGKDIGFDVNLSSSIFDQFDIQSVPTAYRPFVRKLIEEHKSLFSKSDLDCGDVSRTLGTFSLPLKNPLPATNHRIYYLMGKKR